MSNFIEMKVRVANDSIVLPIYETNSSAGMDLRAYLLDGNILLEPKKRVLVGTGLYLEIPEGFEVQIRPRSGLALKYGITVLNSPGTIDADYRGEVKVILVNHGEKPFLIENEMRTIMSDHSNIGEEFENIHGVLNSLLNPIIPSNSGYSEDKRQYGSYGQ